MKATLAAIAVLATALVLMTPGTARSAFPGTNGKVAFATDRNKRLAANFVGGITADGGTDRMAALREAINFAPDVIFFLTDADDPMPPSELAEIAKANRAICWVFL